MRSRAGLILGVCTLAAWCAAATAPPSSQARLAAALRGAVESLQPTLPPPIRTEPTGDVAVDFAPNARPNAVLDEALRLEQQREWRRAAELFQRLLNEVPDELCRPEPRLYVRIRTFVEERIAAFPPEGLAAYRDQVGRQAEEMFQAASLPKGSSPRRGNREDSGAHSPEAVNPSGGIRDLAKLQAVAARFLLSARGDDALDRLATAWLAHGEPGRALRAWQRLLRLCPDTDIDLRSLAAKLAACYLRLGQPEAAQRILDRAAAVLGPHSTLVLAGRPIPLTDVLGALGGQALESAESAPASPASPLPRSDAPTLSRSWPVVGGDATQARIARTPVRPGALDWSDLIQPKLMPDASAPRSTRFPSVVQRPSEPPVSILPILAGGRTIYPTQGALVARDLATGKLVWEWPWPTEQIEERAAGPFRVAARAVGPFAAASYTVGQWVCSANADTAFCSIPVQATARAMGFDVRGELVALDLATGAVRWRISAAASLRADPAVRPRPEDGDAEAGEAGAWFVCPPLPCGTGLIAAVRGGRGSDEYHLVGLRASDGHVLWQTFLASRAPDPWTRVGFYQNWFEAMPAEAEGLVVACAAGGIVAAVEPATGRVQWLARYDQWENRASRPRSMREGWRVHAVAIADGAVYVAPPDSDFLYAFDLDSGQTLWRREREGGRYFIGVSGRRAYVAGGHAACIGPRGEVEWDVSLPGPAAGQPVLAGHVVHIPLAGELLFLDAATGDELARTSWTDWRKSGGPTWSADIASGDLLVAGGKLLVATPSTLNVFRPLASQGELERTAAAEPESAAAHYALGLDRQWNGDASGAAQSLERALAIAGRAPGSLSEAEQADARRRLPSCHEAIARDHEANGRAARAIEEYRTALRYADSAPTKDRLRLRIASLCQALKDWPAAVAAWQEAVAASEMGSPQWERTRAALAQLLREAGRGPYAPFEKEADAALHRAEEQESRLKAGLHAEDPEKDLLQIARLYPDSRAAPRALVRLAARSHDPKPWNYQLVRNHPDSPLAPAALYALAEEYADEGARAMARGALAALHRRYPAWRPDIEQGPPKGGTPNEGQPESGTPSKGHAKEIDAEAFLAAHAPKTPKPGEAALRPPLRVEWNVAQDYGSSDLYVVGGPEASDDVIFFLAGRSLEARSVRDGSRRWADRPAWIGIRIQTAIRPGGGVHVFSPMPDSPAQRVGLREGDIILSLDGQPMLDSEQLIATCSARRGGTPARLVILRDQERLTIPITLGDRPSQRGEVSLPPTAFLGLCGGNALIHRSARLDAIRVQDGKPAWSLPLNAAWALSAGEPDGRADRSDQGRASAAAQGIAIWADARGRLVGIDPPTARTLWTAPLDDATPQDMALSDHGLVVASAGPPALRLVNPFDGEVILRASDRQAIGAPVFALDTEGRLCYAMGSTLASYDARRLRPTWSVRVQNFWAKRLWAAGTVVVALGVDARGNEVLECRSLATGDPVWSLAAQGGETVREAALEPDALYVVARAANRSTLRRIDTSTGRVAWTHEFARGEELSDWEPSAAALCLGLTATDANGAHQAVLQCLDKLTGESRQRLALGLGELVSLTRLGDSIYAVFREEPAALDAEFPAQARPGVVIDPIGEGLLERPQFRVFRIVGAL